MGILTRVEEIISIPLEVFHNRKGFHPVDLNRLALRCMERGVRKGVNKVYAPNRFRVLLNPADYDELAPFMETIRSDISGELRRVADERRYQLAGDLFVKIIKDASVPEGLPQIKGHMEGGKEPESTVIRSKGDTSEFQRETVRPDAETVIVLPPPAPKSRAEEAFEEGMTILREGRVEDAHEILSRAADELQGRPQFHAAMAVALEMMGRRIEALSHYERLLTMDQSQPGVRQRIEWIRSENPPLLSQGSTPAAYGWLELGRPGVIFRMSVQGAVLENRELDPDVSIDGKVSAKTPLKDGARIRIGDLEMVYHSEKEQR